MNIPVSQRRWQNWIVSTVLSLCCLSGLRAAEPHGLVVVYDGSHPLDYSVAVEYSRFNVFGATYQITTPRGQQLSGLRSQIVLNLSYDDVSDLQVKAMEAAAKKFVNAAPVLKPRIASMKNALANPLPSVPNAVPTTTGVTLTIDGRTYTNVRPGKVIDGNVRFTHADGIASVPAKQLSKETLDALGVKPSDLQTSSASRPSITAAPKPEPATPMAGSRLNAEQMAILRAVSASYLSGATSVDAANASIQDFERFATSADPDVRKLAEASLAMIDLEAIAQKAGRKRQEASEDFATKWRGKFNLGNMMLESLRNGGHIPNSIEDNVADAESMATPIQKAATAVREASAAKTSIRQVIRETASALVERAGEGTPQVNGIMLLRLSRNQGAVWMQVTNRTSRTLHQCLISARRVQGEPNVAGYRQEDKVIATGLMALFGFSGDAIRTNTANAESEVALMKAEHGTQIYVPELSPGQAVSFIIAPESYLQFTQSIEASLWCDEGKELNLPASLSNLKR